MKQLCHRLKKLCGVIGMAVLILLVLLAVATSVLGKLSNRPVFWFGHSILWVETGSMEPTIPTRSYILVSSAEHRAIAEGDVITFVCRDTTSAVHGQLITHRVIGQVADGYRTCGDNSSPDPWIVANGDVVSVYVKNLPILTACGRIFASPIGLILIFAVFFGSCAFFYIPDLIRAVGGERGAARAKEKLLEERVKEEVEKLREQDRSEKKQ